MNLFDHLVDEALKSNHELSPLRIVVEKELLHHDILRILSKEKLLSNLTFIGGTCLRLCYGSNRLSEDLDFTGGVNFNKKVLSAMSEALIDSLKTKYSLHIEVSEPKRESGNVDTWVLKIQTRPGKKDLPSQRINIDICSIPSYQSKPMVLLNPYGVEMGTSGLIIQAESREEILADKMLAFALRKSSLKYRDLWDIAWLYQYGVSLITDLVMKKIKDHHSSVPAFLNLFHERRNILQGSTADYHREYVNEMRRFLPAEIAKNTVNQPDYWKFLVNLIDNYYQIVNKNLS